MTGLRCLTLIAAVAGFACSAGSDGANTTPGFGGANSGGGNSGGASGKGGSGGLITGGSGGGGGSITDGGECFGVSQKAENTVRPVDIIMAIDNSGSMTFEAGEVQNNMNTFARAILSQGIDVHVVIISEDGPPAVFVSNGVCIPAPLGSGSCPNDSKPPAYQRINRGVGSTDALQIMIEEYPRYKPTLRQTSLKYFAVVTDDNSDMPAQQFIQAVGTLDAGWFDTWRFFGVYCTGSCSVLLACAATGSVYTELTQQSQTRPGDMCQGQSAQGFATVFTQLAQTVAAGKKIDCQWTIPPAPAGQQFDPGKVNVRHTPTGGTPTDILYVDGLAQCGPNGGWYFDNPQAPTKVLLCPASCGSVTNDFGAQMDVVFGCTRREVPR